MTVRVEDLVVAYRRSRVLDGLDLSLDRGVHGLLGPNGAGKTTLVRVLATVLQAAGGTVRLLGQDVSVREGRTHVRRRLGYLPQQLGYFPGFTVREFVEYMAWLKEVPAARVPGAVDEALERVDLTARAGSRMRTLSGGMLRRAGIAQAIVNDPDLLLLDEPTAGLDPEQRVGFRTLLRELGASATVLVSTHLVEDVASACTGVVLLDAGRVVFTGSAEELAAAGEGGEGDTASERGYLALLRGART
ncbi:MAG TPA: ABC transporter ATP-binding protein [Mycobacteriales bacterium]|nr:ABC transporter ATP-binding protein [Mycobacteriales bacterium]